MLYNTTDDTKPVFPLLIRDVMWHEIHAVGNALEFKESLSHHAARHTFGTLLLSASISIESIAKIMGHTNISSTQIYARITDQKISEDMDKLIERRRQLNNKLMKREIITINGSGKVSVPDKVMMRDFEIAELFGVMIPTVRSNICTILKTGIATGDYTNGATLVGNNVLPDYHGLDLVVALAFRIQSPKAELFRKWVMQTCIANEPQPIVLQYNYQQANPFEQN